MTKLIVVMDDGSIQEASTKVYGPNGVANAYAQFGYGDNGISKEEAMKLAQDAQRQQKREEELYR